MPEGSPSVLVIRLDAIGDALALTPLLAAFRARSILADVVLSSQNAGIFSSRAARSTLAVPFELRSSTPGNRAAIERFGRELSARGYTHVLVATEDPGGYRLARAVGAPVRIGFYNGWGKPLKTLWTRNFLTEGVYRSAGLDARAPHECEVLFRLGGPLLGDARPVRERERLRPLVLETEPAPDPRVAVQITDKWERLGIAFEEVAGAVTRIAAAAPIRLIASDRETAYADRVAAATGVPVDSFATIDPWKSAVGAARALPTPDSGALHVAGMVGTPVVAVFPPVRDFALQTARWLPWAAAHRIVRADAGWPQRAADDLAALIG
jgi:ADP-heptose:LPS heptosyltransferase